MFINKKRKKTDIKSYNAKTSITEKITHRYGFFLTIQTDRYQLLQSVGQSVFFLVYFFLHFLCYQKYELVM